MVNKVNNITSNLMGGLGNYLFQIAAAYSYGLKNGHSPIFNPQTSTQIHRSIDVYLDNILRNINIDSSVLKSQSYVEPGFHYTEIPKIEGDVYLHGYYQSDKYFEGFDKEISELFSCDEKTRERIYAKFPFLKTKEYTTCSIHVRRGDYVKIQDHHPVQSMGYFLKGVKKMPKDCYFMIFSDDIEWCKQNFPDLPEKFFFVENQTDIEDLYTMSFCDHNIICNSTFSWWAAYLNNNPYKTVIAPSNWFGPAFSNHDTKDIYCEGWIKI